jgi:hypothetical protein
VQQFNHGGGGIGGFVDWAEHSGAEQNEYRSDLLSFFLYDVPGNFIQERHTAFHSTTKFIFKDNQLFGDGLFDLIQTQHFGGVHAACCLSRIFTPDGLFLSIKIETFESKHYEGIKVAEIAGNNLSILY